MRWQSAVFQLDHWILYLMVSQNAPGIPVDVVAHVSNVQQPTATKMTKADNTQSPGAHRSDTSTLSYPYTFPRVYLLLPPCLLLLQLAATSAHPAEPHATVNKLFSFGAIADVQYANIADGWNWDETRRRYFRGGLVQLRRAVDVWLKEESHRCGYCFDGVVRRPLLNNLVES